MERRPAPGFIPTGKRVLFASTQDDPEARNKQKAGDSRCERAGSSVGTRGIMTISMNSMQRNFPMERISV